MTPETVFCLNESCPSKGQIGKGNIRVHSQKKKRYVCDECEETFSATKGTLFYRLQTPSTTVVLVLMLLAYGCPEQAIVMAFGFDVRTVRKWWKRAGWHCQAFHQHQVESQQFDLQQVQADEIKAKVQGGSVWMAMAMMVSTRLWLGGAISRHRDKSLIQTIADKVKGMALCRPVLVAVDGLPSYVSTFQKAFRSKLPRFGQVGRCKWRAWPELNLVQVVKQRVSGHFHICRRIVQGEPDQIEQLIQTSQGQGGINTAFIERLNATFRQSLNALTRRTRALARNPETLQAGMYVVGTVYNFCTYHQSLRIPYFISQNTKRWLKRTPAIAAGLTDHRWTLLEVLLFKIPPEPWKPPKRPGPHSKHTLQLIQKWGKN